MSAHLHAISVVIPVYQGEHTLPLLIEEIATLREICITADGNNFHIAEVILVHDKAIDRSDLTMLALAKQFSFVKNIWLSRNFGQHPATIAGMGSSMCQWVVTMDEDGQHDPAFISKLLDAALKTNAQLVYADPSNSPPHGFMRNGLSAGVKFLVEKILGQTSGKFNSFRMIEGEIARSLAAYCASNVFLDVALHWIVGITANCSVVLRKEGPRRSGYSIRSLIRHFSHLILTSGTKPLRFIMFMGVVSLLLGVTMSAYAFFEKLCLKVPIQGWTSIFIAACLFSGLILFALGIIAEYLAVVLTVVMGRPLYLVSSRPVFRREKY